MGYPAVRKEFTEIHKVETLPSVAMEVESD